MPLYDFECSECGWIEENVLQKFDDPPIRCAGFQEGELEVRHAPCDMVRLIGLSHFKLVGKGWPDKDSQELRARFRRRNARIQKMDPTTQQGFKDLIDRTGGKRYIP